MVSNEPGIQRDGECKEPYCTATTIARAHMVIPRDFFIFPPSLKMTLRALEEFQALPNFPPALPLCSSLIKRR